MQLPALSQRTRSFMRMAGVLILLILAVDYATSGIIQAPGSWHKDSANPTRTVKANVPYLADSKAKGGRHDFTINYTPGFGDRYRHLVIVADDCLRKLKINGTEISLKNLSYTVLCDISNGLVLPMDKYLIMNQPNEISVHIEDTQGGKHGISFTRGMVFLFWQALLLVVVAPYLIGFTYCNTPQQRRNFTYYYGVFSLFLLSMTYQSYGMPQLILWPHINAALLVFACVVIVYLISATRAFGTRLGLLLGRIHHMPPKHYIPLTMLGFLALTATLSQLVFDGIPHIVDAQSQYMHAKLFLEGKLYDVAHKFPRFFDFPFVVNRDGKFYSQYYPGHIAFIALAMKAGVPWLTNPILGSLTVGATYLLAREVGGKAAGYVAAALFIASPFIVFISSEYMNHATCLLFLTLFLFCYMRLCNTGNLTFAVLAGFCVGIAFITRAQTAFPFAFPVALHALGCFIYKPRRYMARTSVLALSFGLWLGIFMFYNFSVTGNPLISPYQLARGDIEETVLSTGPLAMFEYGLRRLLAQVRDLHLFLFSWPLSSLIFVLALFAFRAHKRHCGLMIACCLSSVIWLIFNPYNDGIFGPRYLYETSATLIALSAIAITRMPAIVRARLKLRIQRPLVHGLSAMVIAGLIISAFPNQIISLYQRYNNKYGGTNTGYPIYLAGKIKKPALLFMPSYDDFRQVYYTLPEREENPIIFVKGLKDEENKKMMEIYPKRYIYMVKGFQVTPLREPIP